MEQTETPTLHWSFLFGENGKLKKDLLGELKTYAVPCGPTSHTNMPSEKSGIYFFYRDAQCVGIGRGKDIRRLFRKQIQNLNGFGPKTSGVALTVPEKSLPTLWKYLEVLRTRIKTTNSIGEQVANTFSSSTLSSSNEFLQSCFHQLSFSLACSRGEEGTIILQPLLGIRADAGGLYFIKVYDPQKQLEWLEYVGVSGRRMKKTIKGHLRTWRGKSVPGDRDRVEDRREWLRNIKERGWEISVATISMTPPQANQLYGRFRRKIFELERFFIGWLLPPGNEQKKPEEDVTPELFQEQVEDIIEVPEDYSDIEVPF